MARIGGIILAAGASTRMGQPKQLLPHSGGTLLTHTAAVAQEAGLFPVVVVLGAFAETIQESLDGLDVESVTNADWQQGMNTSIRAGVDALEARCPDSDAVVLLTCDQPLLSAAVLRALIAQWEQTQKPVVACEYDGTVGIPALFDKNLFAQLKTLPPDAGAKRLIAQMPPQNVAVVPFPDGGRDMDTPEDYAQWNALVIS